MELNGGNVQVLADSSAHYASAWAPGGTILFLPKLSSPLFRIPAAGGKAVPFGVLGADDYSEHNPAVLPDGKHILVGVKDKKGHERVEFMSLQSSETKLVLDDADVPAYAGVFLFFVRDTKVFAQPFDLGSGKISGAATPIADADWYSIAGRIGIEPETSTLYFPCS